MSTEEELVSLVEYAIHVLSGDYVNAQNRREAREHLEHHLFAINERRLTQRTGDDVRHYQGYDVVDNVTVTLNTGKKRS